MSLLRDAIEARLSAPSPEDRDRQQRLLREILAAFDEGGSEEVAGRLAKHAAQVRQRADALVAALRKRLSGADG
jgi:hypothetical protein